MAASRSLTLWGCENSGLQPLAACARRPTLGVRAAPAMPIKLAKTRKQTKLKLSDLTSLNLTFFSAHETTKVSCPAICQPLYRAVVFLSYLLTCTVLEHQISAEKSSQSQMKKSAVQTLLEKHHAPLKTQFPVAHMQHAVKNTKPSPQSSRPQSC